LTLKVCSQKTSILLLLPSSSTLETLKEEIANALNDTADPPRQVEPADITVHRRSNGLWCQLDNEDKAGKRAQESTLEDLEVRGVGAGSTVDGESEILGYTVENGLEGEETMEIEAYPRDD
jgi:hypothetical protein